MRKTSRLFFIFNLPLRFAKITVSLYIFFISIFSFYNKAESQSQEAGKDNLIIEIKSEGGLCPHGGCYSEEKIFKDGSYFFWMVVEIKKRE